LTLVDKYSCEVPWVPSPQPTNFTLE
jgi:hypothetical protein